MTRETVIGIEVHAHLLTSTKLFCRCPTAFGAPPNSQTCPVCLGHPGVLPVLNRKAFTLALKAALALECTIPEQTTFDRKNYYYPDLPKNYQISQQYHCLGVDGRIGDIRIHNVHLEEDAGRLLHPEGSPYSLVDLNRAGTPLLEIVTHPDLRSTEDADTFMHALRDLLLATEVSDCKMQEGSLRFEASISLRPEGQEELGPRVEIKNLNSMRSVRRSLDHEIERQTRILESGGSVDQETRLWDEASQATAIMRSKEQAPDYRYFPEPDLPPFEISRKWVEEIRESIPELPLARRERFIVEYTLSRYDAGVLTSDLTVADYFEAVVRAGADPKAASNWTTNEVLAAGEMKVPPGKLAELIALVDDGTINVKVAREVFAEMGEGRSAREIVDKEGLGQISGDEKIRALVEKAFAALPDAVISLREGKEKARGAIVGFVMRESKGKANPAAVNRWIDALIEG